MGTKQQFNNLIRNSRPWIKFSSYKTLTRFLGEDEVPWALLTLKRVEGSANTLLWRNPYVLATNNSIKFYFKKAKGSRWDCVKVIPLENITSWKMSRGKSIRRKQRDLQIVISKSKTLRLKKIPKALALEFGNELTHQIRKKKDKLLEKEKAQLQKDINMVSLPEELHSGVKDIESQDKKEIKETKKEIFDFIRRKYVENFVAKYGSGTEGQLHKLKTLIAKRMGYEVNKENLEDVVNKVWKSKAKRAIKRLLEAHRSSSIQDNIEAFVLEFGKGNKENVNLFAEIIDMGTDDLEARIEKTLNNFRVYFA